MFVPDFNVSQTKFNLIDIMDKVKTLSYLVIGTLVLVTVVVVVVFTTKQTVVGSDGKVSTVTSTNLFKKA
jgi:hypothetical protein